jgi:subfamily B ATP-binding cassette protein MsbA
MLFSLLIGILDGFGLTMFLPLLQMVSDPGGVESDSMGKLGFLIDFFTDAGIPLTLMPILFLMLFFFFLKGIVNYVAGIYYVNVRESFIENLRLRNIRGLNNVSYKYFVTSDAGRIQNTLTGEVDRVAASYHNYFHAIQDGVLVAVYMGFAFTMDAQFALLVTVGGILTNFLYKKLYRNTKGFSRRLTSENNLFQSLIIQNVSNYKYLKATGSLKSYSTKLEESVGKIRGSQGKIGKLGALLAAGREPILIFVVVAVIYIQTFLLGSGLGPILVSLLFFYRALNYLMQLQIKWNKFLAVSGSLENMTEFGKELKSKKEKIGTQELVQSIQNLKLSNIFFSYKETEILKGISLEIFKNDTIAFVGESGSGKTTLVNIIAGLLPIEGGKYEVNGIDKEILNVNSFQEKIGYITQDPVIFNDTLFNNISFWGEENANNKEKFWNAVKQASIFDFINELPQKEHTVLGNNGVNLSGGQRQRISIARELFKNVEILILDEATSSLDSETENAIQNNIDQLKGNYTLLIVAHRISTIKNADRIVVMKNGEVLSSGNFPFLLEKSKYFKKLVDLQGV